MLEKIVTAIITAIMQLAFTALCAWIFSAVWSAVPFLVALTPMTTWNAFYLMGLGVVYKAALD